MYLSCTCHVSVVYLSCTCHVSVMYRCVGAKTLMVTSEGHTARWVAEHHMESPYVLHNDSEIGSIIRQSSMTCPSNKSSHNALFGTKLGLYKTMAQSRVYRSRVNGILRSAYLNELQRSVKFGLVNCD